MMGKNPRQVSLKTHKILWGRAASRCAFPGCRRELVIAPNAVDDVSLVGEECHMVAKELDGPRGEPPLTSKQRDAYENLILLRRQPLVQGGREFILASPENTIVNKLEWYEMGGRVSDRQWHDLLGILKRQAASLDLAYLHRWATALRVDDLLEQALQEAGITSP